MALTQLSPAVIVHLYFALSALVLGPIALMVKKATRLHRASGYVWVALMLGAAISSAFIRDFGLPNILGYTPIHLFTIGAIVGVGAALLFITRGNVAGHRKTMWSVYIGGCIGAGLFALLPSRFLGDLVWHQWLALL